MVSSSVGITRYSPPCRGSEDLYSVLDLLQTKRIKRFSTPILHSCIFSFQLSLESTGSSRLLDFHFPFERWMHLFPI